jgi:glutamate synthase domain-containing protein 3
MADVEKNQAFIKEYQAKFDKKLKENEISLLEYWKSQLDKVLSMKPEGIAPLQLQIKRISDMMDNRMKTIKKE